MGRALRGRPVDILLVEDNPADARLAAEALKESGFASHLHWAADGLQALEFLRRRKEGSDDIRPGLILLDLNLPKKDGREVLAELKRDPSLRRIPVVVLTTSHSRDDRDRSYDLHANCFITKPGQWDEFVEVVRSIKDFWFGRVDLPEASRMATGEAEVPPPSPARPLPSLTEGRAPLKVLLVEDSASDIRLVRELLAEAGQSHIEIATAGTVRQAFDLLGAQTFEAILLDLSLPDSQDLEGLATLHGRATGVPIVVMTGLKDEAAAARALRQGAQDYLVKGWFDGDSLARAVGHAIERSRSGRFLEYLAHHDVLTELPNRTLLEDRLAHALEHARRYRQGLAVLFLDLDHFKTVNDTLGHAVGDRLLQAVAARLCGCVRASDTVGRVGGDEFTILLPEISRPEDITMVAGKIKEGFQSPFAVDGRELSLSASIGASLFPNDGEDAESLLKNADTAMYRAKEHGRSNLQLYAAASTTPRERDSLVVALRRALQRRELVLHYQPTVDALSGSIVSLEALVRWQHPSEGLLLPRRFLPVAEETGLFADIGEWVLRCACEQGRAWQRAGLQPLRVAVNVSYRQLNQGRTWVETAAKVLRETGLDPSRLECEVTEESFMRDESTAVKTLRELHDMGIRISVDHFGTGYASLSRLRCFPFASVKIDQTFIHDVTINPDDTAIVAAITAMGHSLRMNVMAEGVATAEQVSFLLRHQIDLMQGPYFSRPLPEDACTRLLRARKVPPVRKRIPIV